MENKRLTKRFLGSNAPFTEFATDSEIMNKLADLEDKIENGELVPRSEIAKIFEEIEQEAYKNEEGDLFLDLPDYLKIKNKHLGE